MSETPVTVRAAARPRLCHLEHVMGMPIAIEVCDDGPATEAVERAYRWLLYVDATFSTYRADSDISRLNRGEIDLAGAQPAVARVLAQCEALQERTNGFFDVRLGSDESQIDPSGLVKGWAIKGAGRVLDEAGLRRYSINAGGDVLVRGHPDDASSWRVGIQHPRDRLSVAAVLAVRDAAVATSGTYARGAHIVDPHTGTPPEGILSVTVLGPDIALADAYATAAFAMGPRGAEWCLGLEGYGAMVILEDDTVLCTPGFTRHRVDEAAMDGIGAA